MNEEYCNLESDECKKYGKVFSDDKGYICALCGKRVSKWLPVINVLKQEEVLPPKPSPTADKDG